MMTSVMRLAMRRSFFRVIATEPCSSGDIVSSHIACVAKRGCIERRLGTISTVRLLPANACRRYFFAQHCCRWPLHRPYLVCRRSVSGGDDGSSPASALKKQRENIATVPNLLCAIRICLTPVLGYLVIDELYAPACGVFIVAALTDLLDGQIARHFPSQQSAFGTALDPLADKFLVSVLVLSLTYVDLIPLALTALIVTRDVCLLSAAFYVRYISLPLSQRTLATYFNPTLATTRMYPTLISKVNTAVQFSLVTCSLAAPVFDFVGSPYLSALWYVTTATTVLSGLSYIRPRGTTFKILTDDERKVESEQKPVSTQKESLKRN